MSKLHEKLSGKNISFLIGSGASLPIFETLSLGEDKPTIENLLSSNDISELNKRAIYYFYFKKWIKPMKVFHYSSCKEIEVLENYKKLVEKILSILETNGTEKPKKANIFTTNYDLLFENTFEIVLANTTNCYFNDGSRGFINQTLNPQCYNLNISQMGYSDNYKREVPTINLLKMHGSVSWSKQSGNSIKVSYNNSFDNVNDIEELDQINFKNQLISEITDKNNLLHFETQLSSITEKLKEKINSFYTQYQTLAIINPDKWKFHETVFEQHYYQLIRNFSYELEKENTVLIVFAFSFADEHIEEIFKRSLSNPKLEVLIICYSENTKKELQTKFKNAKNIFYYPQEFKAKDGSTIKGDFTYLNALLNGDYDE